MKRTVANPRRDHSQTPKTVEDPEYTPIPGEVRPMPAITFNLPPGLPPPLPKPRKPGGLMSVVGTFVEWPEIEEDMAAIIADRQRSIERAIPSFD